MEKTHRLRAPWKDYTDILGGVEFKDSVSEPVDERTAIRLEAAVGCEKWLLADEKKQAPKRETAAEKRERLKREAEEADRLAVEEAERQAAEKAQAIAAAQAELQAAFETLPEADRLLAHEAISKAGMQAGVEAMEAAKAANPDATPGDPEEARVKAGDAAALLQSVSTLAEFPATAEAAAKLAALVLVEGV